MKREVCKIECDFKTGNANVTLSINNMDKSELISLIGAVEKIKFELLTKVTEDEQI